MGRYQFNAKRKIRLCSKEDQLFLSALFASVKYTGSPYHKRNPGDFGLTPPSDPRPGKSLCDVAYVFNRREALALLKEGIKRGLISVQTVGNYPQNIWSVKELPTGKPVPLESQLENSQIGSYHGYPLPETDPMHDMILEKWKNSECLI